MIREGAWAARDSMGSRIDWSLRNLANDLILAVDDRFVTAQSAVCICQIRFSSRLKSWHRLSTPRSQKRMHALIQTMQEAAEVLACFQSV